MVTRKLIGRSLEQKLLADVLDNAGPVLVVIRGATGVGRSTLIRAALPRRRVAWVQGVPLPDAVLRQVVLGTLVEAEVVGPDVEGDPPEWRALLDGVGERVERTREPCILVLDDVEHLVRAGGGLAEALTDFWRGLRAHGLPAFVILTSSDSDALDRLVGPGGPLAEAPALDLELEDLELGAVAGHLSSWPERDRLLAWAAFGGRPSRLRHVDPSLQLASNIQRLLLDPDGPLHREGLQTLARHVQKPERYAGILRALGRGARDWGEILTSVQDFRSGNQLAPYLATLDGAGLVRTERSLDAGPRSRSRRYEIPDPFLGFWFGCVMSELGALHRKAPGEVWRQGLRECLTRHAGRVIPRAVRRFLLERGDTVLPARAREAGALWGTDYEVPVAGTLRNGAPVYGACVWGRTARPEDDERLLAAIRETRYGFGREARIRIVIAPDGATDQLLRRAARHDLLWVVTLEDLLGS